MKRIVISIIVVGGVLAGILAGLVYLLDRPEIDLTIDPQPEIENPHTEQVDELPQDEMPQLSIPDDLYDELDVSDVEVRLTSIADSPTVWRAFFTSDLPISDPSFIFGCKDYYFTGASVILDFFEGQDGRYWVAEANENQLLAIGEVDDYTYQEVYDYYKIDPVAACVLLSHRNYTQYKIYSADIEIMQEGNVYLPLIAGIYIPLPESIRHSFAEARHAVLLGHHLVYQGYDGIESFDLKRWEANLHLDLWWKDVWGISSFTQSPDGKTIAFVKQSWDEEEATVIMYQYSEDEGVYEVGRSSALIAWELGVDGVAGLQWDDNLTFIDNSTLQITEYPEFDQQVVDDLYPPDPGKEVITLWQL